MSPPAEREVHEFAAHCHGVVSAEEAVGLGMRSSTIRRRAIAGAWTELHPGVYLLGGAPHTWRAAARAAVLWGGPRAALSHRAAAHLWGLEGFEEPPIEIVGHDGHQGHDVIVHRLRPRDLPKAEVIDRIPVTAIERTILDLCAVCPPWLAGRALDDALQLKLTDLSGLRRELDRMAQRGRNGVRRLRTMLEVRDESDARTESRLERRLLRRLRHAGLPEPVPQHEILEDGLVIARLDFAYPAERLGIEVHGFRWHGGRDRWHSDLQRDNRLKRMGWMVLTYTWEDVVAEGDRVVHEVRSVLLPASPGTRASRGGER